MTVTTIAPSSPAPSTPPPTLSPGGRTAIRVVLVVAATVLVLGTGGLLTAAAIGVGTTRVITESRSLPTSMRSLVVNTAGAGTAIRITVDPKAAEPRADLRVIGSTRVDQQLHLSADADGAQLTFGEQAAPWFRWNAGEITVVLPPDVAKRLSVTVEQQTGVLVNQAELDQLIARNTNGPILLSGAARRMEAHTRNGDVTAKSQLRVSESFSATTVNGDIEAEFTGAPPHTIEASTSRGDVTVILPRTGPYLIRAHAGRDTAVEVPETNNAVAAAATVNARSDDGDVSIEGSG
jgi:hypothetical protein